MAPSLSYNVVQNGGFESGGLWPWKLEPNSYPVDAAQVVNGTYGSPPFSGQFCLSLESSPGNSANTLTQVLTGLDTSANYTFSAQAWGTGSDGSDYCSAYVSVKRGNSSESITRLDFTYDENSGMWNTLTGHWRPKRATETLEISAGCTFEGSSYTGKVFFDDISLGYPGSCGPKVLD